MWTTFIQQSPENQVVSSVYGTPRGDLLLGRSRREFGWLDKPRDPQRGVFFRQVARPADLRAAVAELLTPHRQVGWRIPDFGNRGGAQISEDVAAVEVRAAE